MGIENAPRQEGIELAREELQIFFPDLPVSLIGFHADGFHLAAATPKRQGDKARSPWTGAKRGG
jgi:hypothetical protein